jgi:hypothetical protein
MIARLYAHDLLEASEREREREFYVIILVEHPPDDNEIEMAIVRGKIGVSPSASQTTTYP